MAHGHTVAPHLHLGLALVGAETLRLCLGVGAGDRIEVDVWGSGSRAPQTWCVTWDGGVCGALAQSLCVIEGRMGNHPTGEVSDESLRFPAAVPSS